MSDISHYKPGDMVVGSPVHNTPVFAADGRKLVDNPYQIAGDPDSLNKTAEDILRMSLAIGASLPDKPTKEQTVKKVKKGKIKPTSVEPQVKSSSFNLPFFTPYETVEQPVKRDVSVEHKTIFFQNDFGKIKMKVEEVVEHDLGFALIFSNEDDIVFEPKAGETLLFLDPSKHAHKVLYTGITFTWHNGEWCVMILVKAELPNDNE